MREDVSDRIHLGKGNIVQHAADAIVNPTDSSLSGRRGVSGAIHRAAGPELREACRDAGPCREGDVRVTSGFRLEDKVVIHLVLPSGTSREDMRRLRKAYRKVFATCAGEGYRRVVLPPFPPIDERLGPEAMARLALESAAAWLALREAPEEVHFCCFSEPELVAYQTAFESMLAESWEEDEYPTDP